MPLTIRTTGLAEYMEPSGEGYIKALICGEAGVGKTPFAARWPDPIFADCENGLMSVAKMGVRYAPIHSTDDMESLLRMLKQDSLRSPEKRQYRTLVIDCIDTYQRRIIKQRLIAERKDQLSGHGDWGWLDAKMQGLIAEVNAMPINVVVNMHIKDVEDGSDEGAKLLVKRSRLKGDIKDSIWQDFDLIGLMEKSYVMEDGNRVEKRQIRWHSEPRFPTLRDRSGTLPRFTDIDFTEQDYWRIANPILGGLDDLPESTDLETLAVEGDDDEDVPGPDEKGGPVASPSLPRPAKKAAAKKTPAKRAAAKKPEPEPEVVKEDPWTPPAEKAEAAATEEPPAEQAAPVEPAVEVEEPPAELPEPEASTSVETETAAAAPAATPEPAAAAAPAARKAKVCGDQPPTMVGKHEPVPGCGRELSAEIAAKAQISMIKLKTYLCDDCFAVQQGA